MAELETEEESTRSEVANYLRDLADQLESGGNVSLELGQQAVSLNPADPITFKLEGESEWTQGDPQAKQSIEFELVWRRDIPEGEDGSLGVRTV